MQRARKGWVRGAVVIGVAGAMMAVALLSPVLAAKKPATKKYVTKQIAAATTNLQKQAFVRSAPITLPLGQIAAGEVACPSGMIATGGGATIQSTFMTLSASVPTDGTGSFASSLGGPDGQTGVGKVGWGAIYSDPSNGGGGVFRVYASCRTGTPTDSNYKSGGPPPRSGGAWSSKSVSG